MSSTSCSSSSSCRSSSSCSPRSSSSRTNVAGSSFSRNEGKACTATAAGPERRHLDPQPLPAAAGSDRAAPAACVATVDRLRDQQPLRFQRPAAEPGEQFLVHDPLVQRVLVDDDQPIVALGDQIAVVQLNRRRGGAAAVGGAARRNGDVRAARRIARHGGATCHRRLRTRHPSGGSRGTSDARVGRWLGSGWTFAAGCQPAAAAPAPSARQLLEELPPASARRSSRGVASARRASHRERPRASDRCPAAARARPTAPARECARRRGSALRSWSGCTFTSTSCGGISSSSIAAGCRPGSVSPRYASRSACWMNRSRMMPAVEIEVLILAPSAGPAPAGR